MDIKIKKVLDSWDIGVILFCKKSEKGVSNHNWIIKTPKGKYILRKVGEDKKFTELEFEWKYLDYLKDKKFQYEIPSPIKNRTGKFFVKIGGSFFWIYKFIEGTEIGRFNHSELKECSKMMATYHKIIEKSNLNNKNGKGDVFSRGPVLKELKEFRSKILKKSKLNKEDEVFIKESSILISLLKGLDGKEYSKFSRYPLHRDVGPENILWKKKKLVGVIDFENVSSQNDTIIKDISVILQYSCRDKKYKHKLDLKLARFFLMEYKKHHRLTKKEIACIPDIITARAIEDFAYAYWMMINDPKRAKIYRLKLYSKVAQWFNKNKKEVVEKLT